MAAGDRRPHVLRCLCHGSTKPGWGRRGGRGRGMSGRNGTCKGCGKVSWIIPLHDDKGGPLMCPLCAGAWHAKHGRLRRAGRVVVKAMKAFEAAGGKLYGDIEILRLAVAGFSFSAAWEADRLGVEIGDITAELLADALQLTHPDKHPEERKELANRVTQELLALKPFVFPAPKPKPPPAPSDISFNPSAGNLNKPSRPAYPCAECATTIHLYYCDA